jgi:ubiquinone/menaquinone biosynthesis C-methylase UbiE
MDNCKMKNSENPWLQIPISDYVGHMSDDHVLQYQMLNAIFKRAYLIKRPRHLLVLGITDGNGLEHVSKQITSNLIALDINPEYIETAQRRFRQVLPTCDFVCVDVEQYKFPLNCFDMVHAGLIFEYVNYQEILAKIARSLVVGGVLSTVIQIEDKNIPKISNTSYKSVRNLESLMKIVDVNEFLAYAAANCLLNIRCEITEPCGGKSFYFGIFKRV